MKIRLHASRFRIATFLIAALFALPAHPGSAEPLKIIVGFPAGSGLDVLTRLIAEHIRVATNNPVIVDNRPGGGGRIAAKAVARAEPDGTTILSAPIVTTAFRLQETEFRPDEGSCADHAARKLPVCAGAQ